MGSINPQNESIQDDLDALISANNSYQKNSSDESRYELMLKATRLVQTIRGPADMLFAQFENVANIGSIRTLLEAGVFDAIPTGGESISASELAERTGVDRELIVRYMRAVTPFGPILETGEEEYAHTPFSEIYLVPQMRAVYNFMTDEFFPPILRAHEFLRTKNWKNDITTRHNPYSLVHDCDGKTMFEHISQYPDRFTRCNDAMMASDSGLVTVGLYPFAEELEGLDREDGVTFVDVGGGRGHAIRDIKNSVPGLKGRFILQDQGKVIEDNGGEVQKYGIEAMAHDFFEPNPIKGALVYYIRRCLHDWPDTDAQQILSNLARSMDAEKSRVLITEYIVPPTGSSGFVAWMDQTMMTFGGLERTEKDWARLLDISGLRLAKVWRAPGVPVGVVEGRLK